jgi:outer membrane protein assembly factor BamB
MKFLKNALLSVVTLSTLSACGAGDWFSDEPPPLKGERISVLELEKSLSPDEADGISAPLIIPPAWLNAFWPQAGGYPTHSMQNLELSGTELKPVWKADIGQGSTDELPLTAQPVLVDGRIFTLDTDALLSAFDIKNGEPLWRQNIADEEEDDPVIGGGLAYAKGVLYVTNGYDEILALNPEDGKIFWRKNIGSPARAAPTVINGRIFVTTLDNKLLTLNAADGAIMWDYLGISEAAGLIGAASAAANNDIVVPVFSSGEISALRVENGSVAWTDNLSSVRRFDGISGLSDIQALPVIDKGLVFSISYSGKMVAIDERSGQRIWQREIGGSQTPWLAGNYLFVLSSDNQLVALSRETGAIHWVKPMPRFDDDDDPILLTGPVFAGGRLFLAGTDGLMIEVAPEDGEIIRQWSVGETITIPPLVATGMLFMLAEDGTLMAMK